MADLLTFTLTNGLILRFTSADIPVTFEGNLYAGGSGSPLIKRDRTRTVLGLEVDSCNLKINADSTHTINGVPFLDAALRGYFDGASVLLTRAFFDSSTAGDLDGGFHSPPVGAVHLFGGKVSDCRVQRTELQLTAKSDLEILDVKFPRNVYQSGCSRTLFDAGCGLKPATYTSTGSVVSAASNKPSITCNLSQAAGYFDQGVLTFTSGTLQGVTRTVKTHVGGMIAFSRPLPSMPQVGAAFTVTPGCDKKQATCANKFNNLIYFRGMPYIPKPEVVT
jgi:uncharacterized phage protein (TIGR02218 family)